MPRPRRQAPRRSPRPKAAETVTAAPARRSDRATEPSHRASQAGPSRDAKDAPGGLAGIADRLVRDIEGKDRLREEAMVTCRAILRASTGAVRTLHQGGDPAKELAQAVARAAELEKKLAGAHGDVYHQGFVGEALQELAEAGVVDALLKGHPMPGPADLHCPPVAYALGLGDAVGELRRAALDAMREARWDDAERMLRWMDALFDALMRIDQPFASGVRRKQDVARALIEKTRGELTVTMRGRSLEDSITDILDELEQGRTGKGPAAKRKVKRRPASDLDLDAESAWESEGEAPPERER